MEVGVAKDCRIYDNEGDSKEEGKVSMQPIKQETDLQRKTSGDCSLS